MFVCELTSGASRSVSFWRVALRIRAATFVFLVKRDIRLNHSLKLLLRELTVQSIVGCFDQAVAAFAQAFDQAVETVAATQGLLVDTQASQFRSTL